MIDGILHVDYESLIPYLSESIKQNFKDIKGLKSESEQIRQALDSMYGEFIKRERSSNIPGSQQPTSYNESHAYQLITNWYILLGIIFMILAGVTSLYFIGQKKSGNDPGYISPLAPVVTVPLATTPLSSVDIERQALIDLFVSTDGKNWDLKKVFPSHLPWLSEGSACNWSGVTCEIDRVTELNLANVNMQGTLPESLGNLEALTNMNLSHNRITGTIPEAIFNLTEIRNLDISGNNVTGTIPAPIARLKKLISLNLSANNIIGTMPTSLAEMKTLLYLDLSSNQRLSGIIPDFPMEIKFVSLQRCNLIGTIPQSMSSLPELMIFDASENQLSGTIPPLQGKLYTLNLAKNLLEGNLPEFSIDVFNRLDLSHNLLSGTINFSGVQIDYLSLNDNMFSGEPILDNSLFYEFFLQDNQFTSFNCSAPIPHGFHLCNANNNRFKCPIPSWLSKYCQATCT